jgi:hypothetical protein
VPIAETVIGVFGVAFAGRGGIYASAKVTSCWRYLHSCNESIAAKHSKKLMKMQNTARDLSVGSNGKNTATKIWRPWFASACFTFITALAWPGTSVAKQPVSLAGEWRFEIAGADAQAFASKLPGRIVLPGTIDDAGLGPKNTKPPTPEGPYRLSDYAGKGVRP